MLLFLLIIVFLILILVNFWYLIRSLMVMAKENIIWAVSGFFLAPIVQIIFYIRRVDDISNEDKLILHLFFIVQTIFIFIMSIGFVVLMLKLPELIEKYYIQ